jgi:putative oxidoreductase
MQRLFSTFPNGWPGCGLLLLRLSCAVSLPAIGTAKLWGWPIDDSLWIQVISYATAALMIGGLWTPAAATCQTLLQVMTAFAGDAIGSHLLLALNGVSLVMLGPGAWSIDARLYGRKRIDLGYP